MTTAPEKLLLAALERALGRLKTRPRENVGTIRELERVLEEYRAPAPASDYDVAEIKRYDLEYPRTLSYSLNERRMEECSDGDWVKYDDHIAAVRRIQGGAVEKE